MVLSIKKKASRYFHFITSFITFYNGKVKEKCSFEYKEIRKSLNWVKNMTAVFPFVWCIWCFEFAIKDFPFWIVLSLVVKTDPLMPNLSCFDPDNLLSKLELLVHLYYNFRSIFRYLFGLYVPSRSRYYGWRGGWQ